MFEGVLSLLSAGKGEASVAAAARTCDVKKEGLYDAGWFQLSRIPGKAVESTGRLLSGARNRSGPEASSWFGETEYSPWLKWVSSGVPACLDLSKLQKTI